MDSELTDFLKEYERANNSHVWDNVEPFIASNAVYWFTDGSYMGTEEYVLLSKQLLQKFKMKHTRLRMCAGHS
jgi:hypothetical protein